MVLFFLTMKKNGREKEKEEKGKGREEEKEEKKEGQLSLKSFHFVFFDHTGGVRGAEPPAIFFPLIYTPFHKTFQKFPQDPKNPCGR